MPEGAVYVGRPGKWGNPYKVGNIVSHVLTEHDWAAGQYLRMGSWESFKDKTIDARLAINLFTIRCWFSPAWRHAIKSELRGHDLACWCKEGEPCHADVLLELANKAQPYQLCAVLGDEVTL